MRLKYVAEISVPQERKIAYDETKRALLTVYGGVNFAFDSGGKIKKEYFAVSSPDFKLRLYFAVKDGSLCGLEYDTDEEIIECARLNLPFATDGTVRLNAYAEADGTDFLGGATLLSLKSSKAVCNEARSLLLLGKYDENCQVFRTLENAFVCLDGEDDICGVFVKI